MAAERHLIGSRMSDQFDQHGRTYLERVGILVTASSFVEAQHAALLDATVPKRYDTLTFGVSPDDVTLYCGDRDVTSVANAEGLTQAYCIIECQWRLASAGQSTEPPDDNGEGITTVGAVVETVQTEFDKNGAEITVKRNATSPDIIQPVTLRRPSPILEHTRLEVSNPRFRAVTHVGTLNDAVWNGYSAKTLLCTGLVGTTRDGGDSYEVRYSFEYRSTWDTVVVYIDEDTGRPISPLVDTVSKKTIELYPTSNFGALSISL